MKIQKTIVILIIIICTVLIFNDNKLNFITINSSNTKSFLSKNKLNSSSEMCEYSDEYLEWLNLSEEDKKIYYMPRVCKIDNNSSIPFQPRAFAFGGEGDALPTSYDLRNVNGNSYVTSVKNQRETGTCWAFAAISAVESNIKKSSGVDTDLSETHVAYSTSYYFKDGTNAEGYYGQYPGQAGYGIFPSAYFSNGKGPISEAQMDFENYYNYDRTSGLNDYRYLKDINLNEIQNKTASYDVNNVVEYNFNSCTSTAKDQIKRYIKDNGALVGYYNTNNDYYNNEYYYNGYDTQTNHAISIVGWDDTISTTNFKEGNRPSTNGAWIIKNSWGNGCYDLDERILYAKNVAVAQGYYSNISEVSDALAINALQNWGYTIDRNANTACRDDGSDNGYYYISYEDNLICNYLVGYNDIDSEMEDNAYYYDYLGWVSSIGYNSNTAYAANIFDKKTTNAEVLTEVTIGTVGNTNYELYFSEDGSLDNYSLVQSGIINHSGYGTIKLNNPIAIQNEKFAVIIKYNTPSYNYPIPVQAQLNGYGNAFYNTSIDSGKSFKSSDGTTWSDLSINNYIVSIKAYTNNIDYNFNIGTVTKSNVSNESLFTLPIDITNISDIDNFEVNIYNEENNNMTEYFTITNKISENNSFTVSTLQTTPQDNYIVKIKYGYLEKEVTFSTIAKTISISNLVSNPQNIYDYLGGTITSTVTLNNIDNTNVNYEIVKNGDITNTNLKDYFTIVADEIQTSSSTKSYDLTITIPANNVNITSGTYSLKITGENDITSNIKNFNILEYIHVSSVTLNKSSSNLIKNNEETLDVTINPESATNKNITWESSQPSIATVNNDGKITAISKGQTTIRAKSTEDATKYDECIITVIEPKITLGTKIVTGNSSYDTSKIYIGYGGIVEQQITKQDIDGNLAITIKNSSNVDKTSFFNIEQTNTKITINVANNSNITSGTYTVELSNSTIIAKTFNFVLTSPPLVTQINAENIVLNLNNTKNINATTNTNAINKILSYLSKNTNIVSVSKDGLVTPISVGSTTIEIASTDGSNIKKIITVQVINQLIIIKNTSQYKIVEKNNEKYINNVSKNTTINSFLDNFNIGGTPKVYAQNGTNEITNSTTKIGTGMILKVDSEEQIVVILGDITGDGKIEINDVSKLFQYNRDRKIINERYYEMAADITGDGEIKINDISKLFQYFRGKINSL